MHKQTIKSEKTQRLDKFLASNLNTSRNQISHLIKNSRVTVNEKTVTKCGYKLDADDNVDVTFVEPEALVEHKVDFDVPVIHEDNEFIIINKPAFLVVHPAPSVKIPTLVDWLKHKNFKLSTISGESRFGIVHRLDKETSGAMVVAKTNNSHIHLSKQLETKTMGRLYLAIIDLPLKENIFIEQPIYRNKNNRLKMSVCKNGKYAKSAFVKVATSTNGKYEIIGAKLFTGRTHQIRAHLAYINRHILGDKTYGYIKNDTNRVFLHSYIMYLEHPVTQTKQKFAADIPWDMSVFLKTNFDFEDVKKQIRDIEFNNKFNNIKQVD